MAKLRGILNENEVSYPSNAKKKELLQLFSEHILPSPAPENKVTKPKSSRRKRKEIPVSDDIVVIESEPEVNEEAHPEPVATPEAKATRKSNKRKSMLDETDIKVSVSPSKGNLFEVESDSDTDLLSPQRKKKKTLKSPRSGNTTSNSVGSPKSADSTLNSVKSSKVDSTLNSIKTPSKSPKTATPKPVSVKSPPIRSETPDSEASTIRSPVQSPGSTNKSYRSADSAQSFDRALEKLKQKDDHFNDQVTKVNKDDRDVELAKLLGIDIQGVKPKEKGKRVVTPRRPIFILEKRLYQKEELSDGFSQTEDDPEKLIIESDTDSESESIDAEAKSDTRIESQSIVSESKPAIVSESKPKATVSKSKPEAIVSESKPRVPRSFPVGKLVHALTYLFLWVGLLGVSFFGYWYREQTFLIGYCGQEIYKTTVPANAGTPPVLVQLGSFLDKNFTPQCVPCPQHARCFPNLELGCYEDFIEYTPWYFSYMPIVDPSLKKCITDTKKAEKIEIMIDVALDLLRARNANENCGTTPANSFEAGIPFTELHDLLLAMKAPYITEEEFEELWERSVLELEKEPEIIVRQVTC